MKKLLSVVLAVLMVMSLATYAVSAAITPTDGWYDSFTGSVYTIGSAEEFAAFLKTSDNFEGKTVILTADIKLNDGDAATWGTTAPANSFTSKSSFNGTFDGQGHTISGFYGTNGLFSILNGATVKNLNLVNTYINGGTSGSRGAIVGNPKGNTTLDTVYVDATVVCGNSSGIVAGDQGAGTFTAKNVWSAGNVISTGYYVSGILGNQESNHTVFENCLNTANIVIGNADHASGISNAVYGGSQKATNCVNLGTMKKTKDGVQSLTGSAIAHCISNGNNKVTLTNCYGLDGATASMNPADDRNTGDNASYKIPEGTVKTIAANADLNALATALGSAWTVKDGKLALKLEFSSDYILIDEWAELTAWAANGSNDAGKTVLLLKNVTAPADATWTSKPEFAGTFDGCGNTISGLKGANGLIAKLTGTTAIKNLSIVDATLGVADGGTVASFAGTASNGVIATFENCYSNAVITAKQHSGGIMGYAGGTNSNVTFKGCWFDGSVSTTNEYNSGILGNQESCTATFIDCLNTGTIQSGADRGVASGISGAVYKGSLTLTNCVNIGLVGAEGKTGTTAFTAIVREGGSFSATNCYALDTSVPTKMLGCAECALGSHELGHNDNQGMEWFTAEEYGDVLTALGATWAPYYSTYEDFIPVPAAFANERPASTKPAEIGTWEELVAWAQDSYDGDAKTYELTADITMPADATWAPKANFKGTFDGKGHKIIGLDNAFITNITGGEIKNIGFIDFTRKDLASNNKGLVSDFVKADAAFTNVFVSGSLTTGKCNSFGAFVGDIAPNGANITVTFTSCWNDADIVCGDRYASGFVGNNESNNTVFVNCLNTGDVEAAGVSGDPIASGFAGAVYSGNLVMTNCVNLGKITSASAKPVGALSFRAYNVTADAFKNCYALEGSAAYLGSENEGLQGEVEGKFAWTTASEFQTLIGDLGADWDKYWLSDSAFIPVPAVFKNEQPVDPNKITISTWEELVAWAADTSNNADKTV
ncbi:MAG: hypothetical protein E7646_01520, partial [Ruminococcaceae bacterium]|nr:hypothetical protein [Oscillospiraceae bacterium]